jgi:hypothetical protein
MTDKKPSEKPLPTPDPERTEKVRETAAEYARNQRAIYSDAQQAQLMRCWPGPSPARDARQRIAMGDVEGALARGEVSFARWTASRRLQSDPSPR